ncbi:MAG TPA: hypothetical protein VEP90_07290, partial [Methylomirabilota bacterium]|nr:hypothetical protein [Methylomirabilota bacterium]
SSRLSVLISPSKSAQDSQGKESLASDAKVSTLSSFKRIPDTIFPTEESALFYFTSTSQDAVENNFCCILLTKDSRQGPTSAAFLPDGFNKIKLPPSQYFGE